MKTPDGFTITLEAVVDRASDNSYMVREIITDFDFTGKFRIAPSGECLFEVTHEESVRTYYVLFYWTRTSQTTEWYSDSKFNFVYERDCSK